MNPATGRFISQDTWRGYNSDPVTLHKYLYANADPANNIDPSGNFSLGGLMSAINIMSTLATTAQTSYNLFQVATGEQEFSAKQLGLSILLSRMPGSSFAKNIAARFKAKTGRTLKIPCMRNSFIAGTLIHTKNGLLPIEEIKIGDFVLSYNEGTGEKEYQKVVHLISHENDYELVKVDAEVGETIITTLDHPFYVEGDWRKARELAVTNQLSLINGLTGIHSLTNLKESLDVYNFTVANTHNYYVGEAGVLVHNANRDCVVSVANMGEFFETAFGAGIKSASRRTGRVVPGQGQTIFKVTKNSGQMKRGDYYYLDGLHKNHIEVFNRNGKFLRVLNLDGSQNAAKTAAAFGRSIRDIIR